MTLKVYNTLSRELEDFKPLEEGKVKAYVCGLTTYDHMHIGHARTYLAFDVIFRYLKYRGYDLTYIQNITDIDDKIIKRAGEEGVDPLILSSEFADNAIEDQKKLGLLIPEKYPKVSENVTEIIEAIKCLIDGGFAYESDGSVYFEVYSSAGYGKLSKQNMNELKKHRVETEPGKKSPLDFALWKKTPDGELGFDSPWGRGRPGWHIECSVMSRRYLGDQFDIHGGALDLVFPHHENEVAQSEALTGKHPAVKYWMHTGFLYSTGEKMTKSLGNIVSVREFIKKHDPNTFRLYILQTHYRSQIDYGIEMIENTEKALKRLVNFRKTLTAGLDKSPDGKGVELDGMSKLLHDNFIKHMDDDFNTPKAVALLFDFVRDANRVLTDGDESPDSINKALKVFDEVILVFGIVLEGESSLDEEVQDLVDERNKHRKDKDWGQADKIRDTLLERGYKIKDMKDGSTQIERISK